MQATKSTEVVAMTPDGQRVILTRETVVIAPPEYSPPGYSPPGYSSQPTITQPPPPAIIRPAITRQPRTQQVVQDIGQDPVHVICPNCQNVITTTVSQEASQQAATACLCMFLCGCWCCCYIPFYLENCQDTLHDCPQCKHRIARVATVNPDVP